MESDKTTISVTKGTVAELQTLGDKGESYEEIIKRTIQFTKVFRRESEFHSWFGDNVHLFGFDCVKENNRRGYPDFVLIKDGAEVRVELETLASNFVKHKHDPTKVDLVICLKNDVVLPVETLEITPFVFEDDYVVENPNFEGRLLVRKIGNSHGVILPKRQFKLGEEVEVKKFGFPSPQNPLDEINKHIKALPDEEAIRRIVRNEIEKVKA